MGMDNIKDDTLALRLSSSPYSSKVVNSKQIFVLQEPCFASNLTLTKMHVHFFYVYCLDDQKIENSGLKKKTSLTANHRAVDPRGYYVRYVSCPFHAHKCPEI